MARSKFPGKPSKPVNRTRINVLPSTPEGETSHNLTTEIKQDDCDSGIDTVPPKSETFFNTVRHCHSTRRTARRKRVCKSLMARKNSIPKRRHLGATSATTSSKKLRGINETSQSSRKKTDTRSEKELSNNRKLTKTKQSHLESSNLVGKFVLPSRSVHSSRVIKPNKRFINVEAVSNVQLRTFKKRVVNKKNSSIKSDTDSKSKYVPQFENNECKRDHNKSCTQKNVDSSIPRTPCSNRRVILRQARLQLHTQTPTGPEGPFSSSNSSSSVSPPGTVTCGVCGAVRFYRFVKQARKFNIYSCESCRKFISKMIKRQVCNKKLPDIQCLKGQGMCHVPPIVRSQHWKFRCAYKARCNACWLKMCLRSFQMPANLKNSLINLLPDFMREPDMLFNNSLSLFSFHTNPSIDSRSSPIKTTSLSSLSLNNKLEVQDYPISRRPVRKKIVKNIEKFSNAHPASDIKRQKIDLKGPRVKHVCRSASIVLGQPLAIFPDESDKKQADTVDSQSKPVSIKPENFTFENDTSENKENNSAIDNKGSDSKLESSETLWNSESALKNVPSKLELPLSSIIAKRERDKNNKQILPLACIVEAKSRKKLIESENSICIDFWENYDPDEVCQSGFGLIASVSFPMPAICFLCGSAGRDPLLFCCLCCEPYHPFCLEPAPKNLNANDHCYDWLCPRCTRCNACGEADKQKLNCQKCHKAYHPECFNIKWQTDDRPTVCSLCLRCKSCGTNNITKFIGNTPLCLMCFRLRKKGNFCPLCQRCYDDNDYDTKMMECGKCNMWIHAKCEGLSEEQYQILSLLPESVEFLCCICEPVPYWRKAVDSELRVSFNNVLRLLSKNRTARNILKWSPMCFTPPSNKVASAARKLQFSDESELSDSSGDNDGEINQEMTIFKKMQKKYKLKELRVTIKPCTIATDEVYFISADKSAIKTPVTPSLTDIKNKLNSNEYLSLREFNENMQEIMEKAESLELLEIYHSVLKQVFPWYNTTQSDPDTFNNSFCDTSRIDLTTTEDTLQNVLDSYKYKMISNIENDSRTCVLCKGVGDGLCHQEARLLYCGNNDWVHANCALWSSEVYEEIDGSLQNVHSAVSRGRLMRCTYCKQKGASIGCCARNCHETYHFSCAHAIKCYFMHDKSIYCPSHGIINDISVISSPADFTIRRSVYVELDKKKRRYIEPKKIQFMVGSLCVTNLGVIIPLISDYSDAIIPSNLSCKRLFWSTIEPWKLIPYVITTRVHSAQTHNAVTDRNFTVDHTLSKILVERKLKEILLWQKDIEKASIGSTEFEDEEEPQNVNAADILSPELTDAILEELPHEFLDGISMQDIFPKLMSNEEILGIDFKIADVGNTELCKSEAAVSLNLDKIKKTPFFEDGKEICDSISDNKSVGELKDSKSETFQQIHAVNKITKVRNHQRSCSVTLSCKVDNALTVPTKNIKVSQEKNMYLQLLQVDGAYDNSSSSDCESATQEIEDCWTPDILDEPVKCERCQCTYRTRASYKRHLESCEVISTSESDSEVSQEQELVELPSSSAIVPSICKVNPPEGLFITHNKSDTSEPYVVASYESYSTYQTTQNEVHSSTLNTHTYVSTESAAEMVSVQQNPEIYFSSFQPVVEQKPSVPTIYTSQSINPCASIPINQPPTITISQPSSVPICETTQVSIGGTRALSVNQQQPPIPISQISTRSNELCISQPPPLYISQSSCNSMVNQPGTISIIQPASLPVSHSPISINQAGTISLNTSAAPLHINQPVEMQSQQLTIQSVPITQEVSPVLNITPSNQITLNAKMLAAPQVVNSMMTQAVTVPHNQFVKPVLKPAIVTQKSVRPRGRPRSLAAKKTRPLGSRTLFVPQGSTGAPSVVVQQLPSTNMIPTFIEAFQQQTGQNLQYITTITPQITSAVTSQPQIVQFQPEGTLVNLVSGVQPAVILPQPPRVLSDQIIVDNNGSLVWASQPVQPIFYGFETIVQNTVLQSQQFLPSAVPGVLTANSSYSSTTQVFQTSKLEPILDVASGNIVLLNSNPVVNSQPLQVPQTVSNQLPPASLVISENKPAVSWSYLEANADNSCIESQPKALPSIVSTTNTATINCGNNSINSTGSSSSINLPVAPFVPEPGIPTNIVTPTPKPTSSINQPRPMNRVLPMPTNNLKQTNKTTVKNQSIEKPAVIQTCEKIGNQTEKLSNKPRKINILDEVIIKPVVESNVLSEKSESNETFPKEETTSLKLVFQKQREGGVYKISNNFGLKNTSSIQIAPLKPIKAKASVTQNRLSIVEQITSEKNTSTTVNNVKQNCKAEPKPLQEKQESAMVYTVETQDGFHYTSSSVADLWSKVFEAVQAARIAHNMPPLPSGSLNMMNSLHIIGLKTNGLKYLLEQLPGADLDDDLDIEHPHGAARFVPYIRSHEPSDMFGWLASKHRKPPTCNPNDFEQNNTRRGSVTSLPMAMRFRHLKLTSKQSVGVYRSKIHKRGLFCHRDIESGEMVIEYAGEVIRSVLADKREKHYTVKGMGCYMFRIDENFVVDATMKGNAARFINHSCEPNCYSKVVEILGHKHIIIFALRKILCGEELTYDYKFPFEEDKIPCTCGSRRCRKFLN